LTQKHVKHIGDTIWENGLPKFDPATIDELQKERIEIPWGATLGASVHISDDLLVSSDFEWRRFGTSNIRYHYDTIFSNGDMQENYIEDNNIMNNAYKLKFGAEYTVNASFAKIPIRAGFSIDNLGWLELTDASYSFYFDEADLRTDSLLISGTYGDPLKGYSLSFGFGMHWSLVRLDFALQMSNLDNTTNGTDFYGPFNAVNELRGTRFVMNFTGLFK